MQRIIAVAAVLLVACGGGSDGSATTEPPKGSVAGVWIGNTGGQTLSLSLVENAGVVSGTGTLTGTSTGTRALIVSGTFSNPSVTATLSSGTLTPFSFQGTLSGTQVAGALSGSGFTNDAITLHSSRAGAGTLSAITVSAPSGSVESETNTTVGATTTDKFGNSVPATINWTSLPTAVATVVPISGTSLGTVSALTPGVATITASATAGNVTLTGSQAVTVTLSSWIGTWNLVSVNGIAVPALITVGLPARVVSRRLIVGPGRAGTWADSTLSGFACSPVRLTEPFCNASGKASVTWSPVLNLISFSVLAGTSTGTVPSSKLFTRQADGSLTASSGSQSEVYRKQ